MLHFWFSCLLKSFSDSAAFLGTSNSGLWYEIILGAAVVALLIGRRIKQSGWASLKSGWRGLFGEALLLSIVGFTVLWISKLIAAPFGLYTEVDGQRKEAIRLSGHNLKQLANACSNDKEGLSREVSAWKSIATDRGTQSAVEEGILRTLQSQNRDQQTSINGCLSQAMKLLTPEAWKMTTIFLDEDDSNTANKKARWILLTNKPVTPVTVDVECDQFLIDAFGRVLGSGNMTSQPFRLSPFTWRLNILSPAWTLSTPLLVDVGFRGSATITCQFRSVQ